MSRELLSGFGWLIGYFVICVICVLLVRLMVKMHTEYFRKILHFILLGSLVVFVYAFQTWWVSVIAAVVFAVIVFPILAFGERFKGYSELLTERKKGEIKRSLVIVFAMFAVVISVFWGWLDDKPLVVACVFTWGFGDASAALVGKRYGRHFLEGKMIEGRKSMEGTAAMFITSFISVAVILLIRGGMPWYGYITTSLITAGVCAVTELYTLDGFDTMTCPLASAAVIIPFTFLWGGLPI